MLRNEKNSPNTLKRKIGLIVGFYDYLIKTGNIKFDFPVWVNGTAFISYKDRDD